MRRFALCGRTVAQRHVRRPATMSLQAIQAKASLEVVEKERVLSANVR
jgi:hypothetical protein